jgi:hypothetical protein
VSAREQDFRLGSGSDADAVALTEKIKRTYQALVPSSPRFSGEDCTPFAIPFSTTCSFFLVRFLLRRASIIITPKNKKGDEVFFGNSPGPFLLDMNPLLYQLLPALWLQGLAFVRPSCISWDQIHPDAANCIWVPLRAWTLSSFERIFLGSALNWANPKPTAGSDWC